MENRPYSALIHDLGHPMHPALESFGKRPRFPVSLPHRSSPDCALNYLSRAETLPDRKSPSQKKMEGKRSKPSCDAKAVGGTRSLHGSRRLLRISSGQRALPISRLAVPSRVLPIACPSVPPSQTVSRQTSLSASSGLSPRASLPQSRL